MEIRTKKVQAKTSITGTLGHRTTRTVPQLELSGNWFTAAGFKPGQMAQIEIKNGQIVITPAI